MNVSLLLINMKTYGMVLILAGLSIVTDKALEIYRSLEEHEQVTYRQCKLTCHQSL